MSKVPINDGNMAVFNVVATSGGGGNQAMFRAAAMNSNNSQNTQAQLAQIKQAALKLASASNNRQFGGREEFGFADYTTVWNWKAGQGGNYQWTYHYWDAGGDYTTWVTAPILATGRFRMNISPTVKEVTRPSPTG